MRWDQKQSKLENKTYEIIDEIAEEIGVNVPYLPEVYWVGKNLKFESLGVGPQHRGIFNDLQIREYGENEDSNEKIENCSAFLKKEKIILLGRANIVDVSEEATHFLHFINSNLKIKRDNLFEYFGQNTIAEMFGFFGSKLIWPQRKSLFETQYDPLENKDYVKTRDKLEELFSQRNREDFECLVYNQAYNLGENLFGAYISGEVPMKQIRKLFTSPLAKKNEAAEIFLSLKSDFIGYWNSL